MQSRITEFWNTVAPDYDRHPGNVATPGTRAHAAWVNAIGAALPDPPSDVLDVGTGTGFLAAIAAELGNRVIAIDLAPAMLSHARRLAEQRNLAMRFALDDAVRPSFADASFDAIVSRSFIWTLRELDAALCNWHRLLRPGGRVIAFGGFDVGAAPVEPAEAELPSEQQAFFERYYSEDVRRALPDSRLAPGAPIVTSLERAGFTHVQWQRLDDIERLDPAYSPDRPPHVLSARR